MPSLKEVRLRIASVKTTQQITSAMKMVSASKLRRAQNAILTLRPYANKINEILQNLTAASGNSGDNLFFNSRYPEKVLLVVIASNRGMCGAFNASIIKTAIQYINENYPGQQNKGNVSLLCIGKKATDFFKKRNYNILAIHDHLFDQLTFDNTTDVARQLMQFFVSRQFDKIELVYNQFKNPAVQKLIVEQYLPFKPAEPAPSAFTAKNDYIFEPDEKTITDELIPKSLTIQFYKALLDSFASEHGARMTAMHKATDNAQEIIKKLTIMYNKARQATITNEILEIVSGANALKQS
ncbi:MAG: ATP synthase F1 subunit gamma [Lentimicrobiaceae bacterium]|nr:ATP synthase F1 subunit gamma [Lentimicrobiaceae bacterium]